MSIRKRAEELYLFLFNNFKQQWQRKHTISEISSMSIKELFIIQTLGMKDDSATMSELADIFYIPATTMTNMIDRLVNKNYLKRFRSKKDRRVVKVSLTKKGRELFDKHYELSIKSEMSLLEKLSAKEQEIFMSLLKKIFKY